MASSDLAWSAQRQDDATTFGRDFERVPDFQRLRLRLYGLILVGDGLAMVLAFLSADLIRFGRLEGYGLTTFMVLFPTYVAVALNGDAWSIASLERPRHSAASAIRAFLFALAIATVFFFSLKVGEDFSRLVFGIGSCIALGTISGLRLALGKGIGRKYRWSFRREVLILDGVQASRSGQEIVVDAAKDRLEPAADDPSALDRLARLLDRVERVIVACPPERRQAWIRTLAGANLDVEMLAPELASVPAIGLRRHGATPALLVGCGPLPLHSRALKRLMDLAVAGGGLVLLGPLMLVVAAAIRIESPGPALFRQVRMGRGNRLFEILKFRTMRSDAADGAGARSVSRGDDRVTRLGRFLRSTSIDELPQLLNVLKGEMSIVGPRPHPLGCRAETELFWAIDEHYFDRHAIKPGLTGLAQVRGFRGATEKRSDVTDRVGADLEYIDGWHIGRDVAIIVRTVGVLIHPNAF
jgi:lipopolysaccharide/colanic/teichoic acid biosynthesis glycosyltransferase